MNILFKFLATLIANMIWQRVGGKGAIPPVRLPRSGKHINVPAVGSWQMMIAMWVLKKFWHQYGGSVKTRLTDMPHPVPRRVGSWLPDAPANTSNLAAPTVPTPLVSQPAISAPATSPAPVVQYNTQRLKDSTAHGSL